MDLVCMAAHHLTDDQLVVLLVVGTRSLQYKTHFLGIGEEPVEVSALVTVQLLQLV